MMATSKAVNQRTDLSVEAIQQGFRENLFYLLGRFPEVATLNDNYTAIACAVRDRLLHHWVTTASNYFKNESRTVCYLSAEFLLGPHLGNNLLNLGIEEQTRKALSALDLDLDRLLEQEVEPGLGNGGLGRLAACYLDSLASLQIPAIGYGIRYEFGIFEQQIRNGHQVELTDKWLRLGNPWEIPRPEASYEVKLGGHTEGYTDNKGQYRVRWIPERVVKGTPYDSPVLGYRVGNANLLRLWKAEAAESFDFQAFNTGDYYRAVDEKVVSENLTKVLYPNDESVAGKRLRLEQQYFFVCCSLQDMIRIYLQKKKDLDGFHEKYTAQLNDTHPAVAIAELMRLLVDEHGMEWERAWAIVTKTFGYTNHTLLPEALEKWPIDLFATVLPRHLQIIFEINRRFLEGVRARYPGDTARLQRLSLIEETGERAVRMAHLACVGSYSINGVAELHTDLLKSTVLRDFHDLMPEKFTNVTNGVTPRRFLMLANPRLAALITKVVGDKWPRDLQQLRKLERFATDPGFCDEFRKVKLAAKQDLAAYINRTMGITVRPDSLFDIQAKRIHEYKRQHLNVLHIIHQYLALKRQPGLSCPPRTYLFGGKAAPGYYMAKLIIHLIHSVARVLEADPGINTRLKVVFLPNFSVKNGQRVYPAADLSEQISTAGKEASGTGNMKFSMNGALTIGTLDGANVEIREEVGAENFFLFGHDTDEIQHLRESGYQPGRYYEENQALKDVIDLVASGHFSQGDTRVFAPLVESLLKSDPYFVLADYQAYVECQRQVDDAYSDPARWTRMSILNVARMGKFSSDRAILEYSQKIWQVQPMPIDI